MDLAELRGISYQSSFTWAFDRETTVPLLPSSSPDLESISREH